MKLSLKTAAATLASVIALSATSVAMADEAAAPTPAPAATTSTPLQTRPVKKLELASQNEGTPVGYKLLAGAVVVAGAIVYAKKKKGGLTKDAGKKKTSSIDLLARRSVGVRSEVLVVEVEGTRLLVGMTPGSMSTLAVLQTPEGVIGEESPLMGEEKYMDAPAPAPAAAVSGRVSHPELSDEEEDDEPAPVKVGVRKSAQQEEVDELEGRVRSLLDARKKKADWPKTRSEDGPLPAVTTPAPKPARKAAALPAGARSVPGQAKGLLLSMQDADVTKLGDW